MTKAREIIRKRTRLHISRRELAILAGVMQRTMVRIETGRFRQGRMIARMIDEALLKLPIPTCFGGEDGRCPLRRDGDLVPTPADCYLCELHRKRRRETSIEATDSAQQVELCGSAFPYPTFSQCGNMTRKGHGR